GTAHKVDVHSCTGHGCVSMPVRICASPQDHGHTSHSVYSPASHVPRRTCRPSAWDSRDRNTVALAFLASAHLAFRAKGKPCRIAPARLVPCPVFLILTISQGQ